MSEVDSLRIRLRYACWQYWEATGSDVPWLTDGGELSYPDLFCESDISETGEPTIDAQSRLNFEVANE